MHQNFSQMLKTTLNKMKDRIDKANKQWENENDTNLIQKFKEIVDNGQDKQWRRNGSWNFYSQVKIQ